MNMDTIIDEIEEQTLVAEMNVINALITSYTKESIMCEYVSEDTMNELFYQEGAKWDKFKDDVNAGIKGKQGEGVLKKILMFIPRLIAAIIKKLKNMRNKKMIMTSVTDTVSHNHEIVKQIDEKIKEITSDPAIAESLHAVNNQCLSTPAGERFIPEVYAKYVVDYDKFVDSLNKICTNMENIAQMGKIDDTNYKSFKQYISNITAGSYWRCDFYAIPFKTFITNPGEIQRIENTMNTLGTEVDKIYLRLDKVSNELSRNIDNHFYNTSACVAMQDMYDDIRRFYAEGDKFFNEHEKVSDIFDMHRKYIEPFYENIIYEKSSDKQ